MTNCETCDGPLVAVETNSDVKVAHCGRCGTLRVEHEYATKGATVPLLVHRVRAAESAVATSTFTVADIRSEWNRLNVAECIYRPAHRRAV